MLDESLPLTPEQQTYVRKVVGIFLYYARAVDCTMLAAVSKIASMQAEPTQRAIAACSRLLDYAATWPQVKVVYLRSDMILKSHSDVSYLTETRARSRVAAYLYFTNTAGTLINGGDDVISAILSPVCSSISEAEYAGTSVTGQTYVALRPTLEFLGHPQGPTVIVTDNSVAQAIANGTCKQKRSRAIYMRFHWMRDRVSLNELNVVWEPGKDNLADYFTKAHPPAHHRAMRSTYVRSPDKSPPRAAPFRSTGPKQVIQSFCGEGVLN